jgi:NhaP-type Na+/H+ or K+/H+ antiporter
LANHEVITLTIGLALWLGVTTLSLARYLRMPPLLFYIIAGVAVGPMGLGWLAPKSLGDGLPILVEFGLAIILFEGALSLPPKFKGALPLTSRKLLAIGMPLTAVLSALTAYHVAGLDPLPAAVFGALIVVTGPTTIGPLLRSLAISRRLETLLRNEAIWGDCLGILLASAILPFWIQEAPQSLAAVPYKLLEQAALSAILGIVMGFVLGKWILPLLAHLGDPELPGMVALGWAVLAFTMAQTVSPGSGPIASAVAGFTLAVMKSPFVTEIRHFKGQIAYLFIGTLFVLLSGLFDLSEIHGDLVPLLLATAVLGVLVRPLSLSAAFFGTDLPSNERAFAAMLGPRGIIALATASYIVTQRPDDEMARLAFALTFLVIFFSGAFASVMGRPLAWALGVKISERSTGVVLVGIHDFSKALAAAMAPMVPVKMVDSDPLKVEATKIAGVEVIEGNALSESLYEEAAELGYRRVLAMTPNDALNDMILEHAEPIFGRNRAFRVFTHPVGDLLERRPRLRRQLAFSERFHLDLLSKGGSWSIKESSLILPGQWPLVSFNRRGVRLIRADAKEEPPYLVLEVKGSSEDGRVG